jgi:hypothetical protein
VEISFVFDDDARLDGRGLSAGDMAGRDGTDFKDLLVSTGFTSALSGEIEPHPASEEVVVWSIVRDLRIGIGFGEVGGEVGVELADAAGCQRSRTDDFLGAARAISVDGVLPNSLALASSWVLLLIMLWTKPRPLSLLKLGVGSFSAGGRRKARDGFFVAGICGPVGDCRGSGWMGRASEGIVIGDDFCGVEDAGEVEVTDCLGVYGREVVGGEGVLVALVGVLARISGREDFVAGRRALSDFMKSPWGGEEPILDVKPLGVLIARSRMPTPFPVLRYVFDCNSSRTAVGCDPSSASRSCPPLIFLADGGPFVIPGIATPPLPKTG